MNPNPHPQPVAERKVIDPAVDLLFGNLLEELDADLRAHQAALEERLQQNRSAMQERVEEIDRSTREQIGSPADASVGGAALSLEQQLDKLSDSFSQRCEVEQRKLRTQLAKAAERTERRRTAMEDEIARMKESLGERDELGGLFAELGKRL